MRNISLFVLVLFFLRRASIALEYVEREEKITKITGPWKAAIQYVLSRASGSASNAHYDSIFEGQFFDLNQHSALPLSDFVDILCSNFTRYQRFADGAYQIVPTPKQKDFLQRIIKSKECFHFSEVGSGKTKVILPLLCQTFLSSNTEAHEHFARGGEGKHIMVICVPEHLVADAKAQIFRYCLNLNFGDEYRIHDDIFALLHDDVQLRATHASASKRPFSGSMSGVPRRQVKMIFITSFNQFKKALTYDKICTKVHAQRERILVVADEVDDFLDRDKLVFNICSNKANSFAKPTLDAYYQISRAVYRGEPCPPETLSAASNAAYWQQLHDKCNAIHLEVQEKSRSLNKSFGIFNEQTLRHCNTNVAQDVEGYKSLIARPYESVNRAMPGSYYSDVERTIYLTYYILMEDTPKYDELFQQERKFISFEYYSAHIRHVDYDDLVYGNSPLSALVTRHPETKDGLTRFLYEIVLRRLEIRDKSRSVNSIDIVFNFDAIGFTGTPFIDNYPTFAYIRSRREDQIPDMIDRSFYAYAGEGLAQAVFEERFARFQGENKTVLIEYVPSGFMRAADADELDLLERIFTRGGSGSGGASGGGAPPAARASSSLGLEAGLARTQLTSFGTSMEVDVGEHETSSAAAAANLASSSIPSAAQPSGGEAMEVEAVAAVAEAPEGFNVLVDLCGIFKKGIPRCNPATLLPCDPASAASSTRVSQAGLKLAACPARMPHFALACSLLCSCLHAPCARCSDECTASSPRVWVASIYDVRDVVRRTFGTERFHYIYHIDQTDGGDRVLYLNSDNDVQFDDEFYKFLCKTHGASLRERVFFFIDNRNVIGKDIPFQLVFQRRFGMPLFYRSAVLAHDVSDFSKIWQAMGRSRTMNATRFTIFTSQIEEEHGGGGLCDIKSHPLTRSLYVQNCDSKMAGNLSSIYQTLVSLFNLSQDKFYYCDEIVNVFIEKMEMTIAAKVSPPPECGTWRWSPPPPRLVPASSPPSPPLCPFPSPPPLHSSLLSAFPSAKVKRHESSLASEVLGTPVPAGILSHILGDKFVKSARASVSGQAVTSELVRTLLGHVVHQKFEQRAPSGDVYDELLGFLCGGTLLPCTHGRLIKRV